MLRVMLDRSGRLCLYTFVEDDSRGFCVDYHPVYESYRPMECSAPEGWGNESTVVKELPEEAVHRLLKSMYALVEEYGENV